MVLWLAASTSHGRFRSKDSEGEDSTDELQSNYSTSAYPWGPRYANNTFTLGLKYLNRTYFRLFGATGYHEGPTDHIEVRVLQILAMRAKSRGIPGSMLCRIPMFVWSPGSHTRYGRILIVMSVSESLQLVSPPLISRTLQAIKEALRADVSSLLRLGSTMHTWILKVCTIMACLCNS